MGKRRKNEQRTGTCVYCGASGPITNDHVFPRTIFPVRDLQMVTVPACADCNKIKSLGERDLRDFIVLDPAGSQHENSPWHARKLINAPDSLSVSLRSAASRDDVISLYTASGAEIAISLHLPYRSDRMNRTVAMMVRGLHYHRFEQVLPAGHPIDVQPIPHDAFAQFWRRTQRIVDPIRVYRKGNGVVWWTSFPVVGNRSADTSDDLVRQWIICFHESVGFCCGTGELATFQNQFAAVTRVKYDAQAIERIINRPDLRPPASSSATQEPLIYLSSLRRGLQQ